MSHAHSRNAGAVIREIGDSSFTGPIADDEADETAKSIPLILANGGRARAGVTDRIERSAASGGRRRVDSRGSMSDVPRTARARVLRELGAPVGDEELELTPLTGDVVQVRVLASGACQSDLRVVEGGWEARLPSVLGHEGAGVVEDVGPESATSAPARAIIKCCG